MNKTIVYRVSAENKLYRQFSAHNLMSDLTRARNFPGLAFEFERSQAAQAHAKKARNLLIIYGSRAGDLTFERDRYWVTSGR